MSEINTCQLHEAIIHTWFRLSIIGLWSMIGSGDNEAI